MRKAVITILVVSLVFALSSCGKPAATSSVQTSEKAAATATPAAIPDLTGTWKQVNSSSDTMYHQAVISGSTIEINWINTEDESSSLYWSGTYVAPTSAQTPYTWDSQNDTSKTGTAMLASSDATKTFTYENGQISYSASALGTTKTVRLEKQ